jgi:intracellular multiplication protein IcmN
MSKLREQYVKSVKPDAYSLRLLLVCILFSLIGCNRSSNWTSDDVPTLPSRINGASDKVIIDLQKKLSQNHIEVISIGQEFMISAPAKILFYDESPRITWAAFEQLNDIAYYLRQFRKVEVHVNAYSSKYQSVEREQALTTARARAVGNYLRSQGIDSRFIFTQGMGSNKPILSTCGLGGDKSPNARVEIIFRETIV